MMIGTGYENEFILRKRFKISTGHRLSKHNGLCKNIHGHTLKIEVSLKSNDLDDNNMVLDFGKLKEYINDFIKSFDHCMLLNKEDADLINFCKKNNYRYKIFPDGDPTAEVLAKYIYQEIKKLLPCEKKYVLWEVRIWENEDSDITYFEYDLNDCF